MLVVGNITEDFVDKATSIGGAVSYAAAVTSAFGARACIVTAAKAGPLLASEPLVQLFRRHKLRVVPSNATLGFKHTYNSRFAAFWGSDRQLRVTAHPNVTLAARHVPWWWRRARVVLLCPLTADDVDVSSFTRRWHGRQMVGLMGQGLQRKLDAAGHVSTLQQPFSEQLLALFAAGGATVFLSDVETEHWSSETWDLLRQLPGRMLVTRGARGAEELNNGVLTTHKSFPTTAVVDTNGAGDTFASAYMLALLRGHPAPADVANWAGALAVGQPQLCKPACVTETLKRNWKSMFPGPCYGLLVPGLWGHLCRKLSSPSVSAVMGRIGLS